jgi:hypothetical protein
MRRAVKENCRGQWALQLVRFGREAFSGSGCPGEAGFGRLRDQLKEIAGLLGAARKIIYPDFDDQLGDEVEVRRQAGSPGPLAEVEGYNPQGDEGAEGHEDGG